MPSQQVVLRRRYLVKILFEMGHKMSDIADMLRVSSGTINRDLSVIKVDRGKKSVKEHSLLYRSIAAILSQRKDEEDLRKALYRWRPLAQLESQARAIELVYRELRVGTDLPEKYRRLVNDLIGYVYFPVRDNAYYRNLPEILRMISRDKIPETENELIGRYVRQSEKEMKYVRNEIALCWCPAVIIYNIDEVIASFDLRIQQVLDMRYAEKKTLEQIGKVLGKSPERIRQIQMKVLRQLRARINFRQIMPSIATEQAKIRQLEEQLKHLQTGALLYDDDVAEYHNVLYRSVAELELSVRAANCLQNVNIRLIGELVQKSENKMLRINHFGRTSFLEVKEALANLGLTLEMSGPEIDAFNIIRTNKKKRRK